MRCLAPKSAATTTTTTTTTAVMAPTSAVSQSTVATKMKRPVPPGIQTNGPISSTSSPSPSLANKKMTPGNQQQQPQQPAPNSASDRNIAVSTVRPINRMRREANAQNQGRNSRNSAGIRTGEDGNFSAIQDDGPPPYGKLIDRPLGLKNQCIIRLTLLTISCH